MNACGQADCDLTMPHRHEEGDGGWTLDLTPKFMARLGMAAQELADLGVSGAAEAAADVRRLLRENER